MKRNEIIQNYNRYDNFAKGAPPKSKYLKKFFQPVETSV